MAIPNQNRAFPIKRRKTEDTLVSWDSVTTANGNAGGISLIDSGLIGMNDFITNQVTVIILGGAANLERQLCTAFNPATGEVDFSPLSAQIVAGTPYRLTGLMSPEVSVAGLAADLAVPLPNSANNVLMRDVVGNKTDTPVSTVGATASLMAYMKAIINGAGGTGKIYMGITVPAAGSLTIDNDVLCIGDITVGAGGTLVINGDCHCTGNITNTTGSITILGDVHCVGNISNGTTHSSTIIINGDCYCSGEVENSVGFVNICGNLFTGSLTQDDPTANGDLNIYGNATVYNTLIAGNADGFLVQGNLTCVDLNFLPNGYFEVGKDVSVDALNVNQDGIHFTINGGLTVTASAFSLGQGVSGSMTVGGHLYCSGGYTVNVGASLTTGAQEVTGNITVGDGAIVTINGDLSCAGAFFLGGGTSGTCTIMGTLSAGSVTVANGATLTTGTQEVTGGITMGDGAALTISGSVECAGNFNAAADGIVISIDGSCSVSGDFFLGGGAVSGSMTVSGDATIAVGASLTAGPLTVNGNITNAGTITSNGGILYAGTYTNTGTVVNKMYKTP